MMDDPPNIAISHDVLIIMRFEAGELSYQFACMILCEIHKVNRNS
jgi:hypothetical protein